MTESEVTSSLSSSSTYLQPISSLNTEEDTDNADDGEDSESNTEPVFNDDLVLKVGECLHDQISEGEKDKLF